MSNPVEAYFSELRDIHNSGGGVSETSYYGALSALLNQIGHSLKPKVRCVMQLRNLGAGMPDGGLFTQAQFGKASDAEPAQGQTPARGVIEVKGTGDDVFTIAASEQVMRYLERYGLVLVTNLRDFVLVGRDQAGQPRTLESCRLSETEAGFWAHIQEPRKFAAEAGEGLVEFLKRVLLHNAPLMDPKDLAWFLASYARTARLRLEQRHELPALAQLRTQLEEALGLEFEGEKGDHFFRSTLVQTLFYGVFAAWVLWSRAPQAVGIGSRFEWELASRTLDVPMISALYYQFADPNRLKPLGIDEVLDWTEDVLARVDRAEFFKRFREEHAVQYFYEPFLEAFDPQLRKELGVWYTPDEVVRYMVARVDTVLREELDIADGLADPSVYVLDPCCGTGAYLVEVLRKIDETLQAKGADALTRQDVKRAAMERVIGFEIMPAPFVVAHLQLGLLLTELGVPLQHVHGEHERVAVYLTNALTGWNTVDPNARSKPDKRAHPAQLLFEFEQERDAAAKVKREAPILVVLGNPPYNGFAGMAVDEERDLSDAYRTTLLAPKPQGQGLNDLYVRFYRMAERQVVARNQRGVVCLITNNSWLDGLSFSGMRERFMNSFDRILIDNLNGDKYKTGKSTPEGKPDPSVFSTAKNREGIQVGAAITCLVRRQEGHASSAVEYRDLWGASKLAQLSMDATTNETSFYAVVKPELSLGLPFIQAAATDEYAGWPSLVELLPKSFPGVQTKRDDFVVDIDLAELKTRIESFASTSVSEAEMVRICPKAMEDTAQYDAASVRRAMQRRGVLEEYFRPYCYRPFDMRWIYWEPEFPLLSRRVPDYFPHTGQGGPWLLTTDRTRKMEFGSALFTRRLADLNCFDSGSRALPLWLTAAGDELLGVGDTPNLSRGALDYLTSLGSSPEDLFFTVFAILKSRQYQTENGGALRHGWPRIPLPAQTTELRSSADLGRSLSALFDVDVAAAGVTSGAPTLELTSLGLLCSSTGRQLDPSCDLAVTARWGTAGRGGICMPSTGKLVERDYTSDELDAIAAAVPEGLTTNQNVVALLGERCFDVYLNDVAYWRCVPSNVWRYTIGGYQVIKKWLSYREKALLGRDLKPEEARYVTEMVRRIAALVLMQPELDANYERVKADVWEWGK